MDYTKSCGLCSFGMPFSVFEEEEKDENTSPRSVKIQEENFVYSQRPPLPVFVPNSEADDRFTAKRNEASQMAEKYRERSSSHETSSPTSERENHQPSTEGRGIFSFLSSPMKSTKTITKVTEKWSDGRSPKVTTTTVHKKRDGTIIKRTEVDFSGCTK